MYSITLTDGTVLENLELNGNNYISDEFIDSHVFDDNLDVVVFTHGDTTETVTDMKLMNFRVERGRFWFILAKKSHQEIKEEAMNRKMEELRKAMSALLTGEV